MKRLTTKDFIERARRVHGDKYDYSKTNYVNAKTDVCITCRKHGDFMQPPFSHMKGCGCRLCANEKISKDFTLTKDEFERRSRLIHGNKYNYSLVEYKSSFEKVKIICPIHGIFEKSPSNHWKGQGCPICNNSERNISTKRFIEKAKMVHGNKYDYSNVEYKDMHTKVKITCPIHGEFLQEPQHHLNGSVCQFCKASKGEDKINLWLSSRKINFIRQKCIYHSNLFVNYKRMYIDFFIPSLNIAIEYNGEQHYRPVSTFGGEEQFKQQQERDMALREYCAKHKIKLIEIPYWDYNNIETILKKELKIHKKK